MKYYEYIREINSFKEVSHNNGSLLPYILWPLTDKCIYSCPFCFQSKTDIDYDVKKLDEYMRIFKDFGVQKVDVSGGEPLLYDMLSIVCNRLVADNINISITTTGNGKKEVVRWFNDNMHLYSRIIMSLNGGSEEVVDKITGVSGSFKLLMRAIDKIIGMYPDKLRINTVFTSHYKDRDRLNELVLLIKKINPAEWCCIQPYFESHTINSSEFGLKHSEFSMILDNVEDMIGSNSKIKVLRRANKDYKGYWVLYPNGYLKKHSLKDEDFYGFKFEEVSRKEIQKVMDGLDYIYPIY